MGEPMTTAMPIDPISVIPVATNPMALGRRELPAGAGSGMGAGSQRGRGRGVRRTVRRHGSPGVAVRTAPPTVGPAARPTRRRLAPSTRTESSGIVTGSPIGSGPMRPVTRPVSWTKRTTPSASTSSRPWWGSSASSATGTAAPGDRPTTCRPGGRWTAAPAPGPASTTTVTTAPPSGSRTESGHVSGRPSARAGAGSRRLPLTTPTAPSESCGATGRPSSSSGPRGSSPRAAARSARRSSTERGATITRRPAGPSMSTVGIDGAVMTSLGAARRRKGKPGFEEGGS